jgi:histidyl-tRNA synthetase
LIEMLGGRPTPACGFALGVERILELMREQHVALDESQCDVYVVHSGDETLASAVAAAEALRDAGLDVLMHCGGGSFKSQFRRADASGAAFAVIIGPDELARGEASLKWLRDEAAGVAGGRQESVSRSSLGDRIVDAMSGDPAESDAG